MQPLDQCPGRPNCVCSEYSGNPNHIWPVPFFSAPEHAWSVTKKTVFELGGRIVEQKADYLHAIFRTPIMKFTDDFELRLDREKNLIQIRSSSRIGYYDFGTNRKRAELFNRFFSAMISGQPNKE